MLVEMDKIDSCTFYKSPDLHVLLEAFSLPSGYLTTALISSSFILPVSRAMSYSFFVPFGTLQQAVS